MTLPPMTPATRREVILSILEDWGVAEAIPVDRLSGLVQSLDESWAKDRRRAEHGAKRQGDPTSAEAAEPEEVGFLAAWCEECGALVKIPHDQHETSSETNPSEAREGR